MGLNKNNLREQFESAKREGSRFVFVKIEAEGVSEVICIPKHSFEAKQEFYERTYTEDLVHVMNKNVSIRGLFRGDAKELERLSN